MKLDRGANILASNRMIEEPWLEQIISLTFNMNCMTESFAIFSRSFTRLFPIFFFFNFLCSYLSKLKYLLRIRVSCNPLHDEYKTPDCYRKSS